MRLATLAIALLAGCAPLEPGYPGADMAPHEGGLEGFHRPVVVSFRPQSEVTSICDRIHQLQGTDTGNPSLACASFSSTLCTVYIAPPSDHRDVLTYAKLHHELLHCAKGNWHD